jgi:structural maintenance of chromosome 4
MGGDAEMEPRDHMDPFAEGIEFTVKPPKKSWKGLCARSVVLVAVC